MISSIRGIVLDIALDRVEVEVSGIGLTVYASPSTLADLHQDEVAFLRTQYVPRQDDAPLLFGFATAEERTIFTTLLGISGIGPRLALAVLSVHTPAQVRAAIQSSDTKAFTKVPGIGTKTAQRILLELAGKLVGVEASGSQTPTAAPASDGGSRADVLQALISLGWSEKDAAAALDSYIKAHPDAAEITTPALLRAVLRSLGTEKAKSS